MQFGRRQTISTHGAAYRYAKQIKMFLAIAQLPIQEDIIKIAIGKGRA